MSEPSLALQSALRTLLVENAAVIALVPANHIIDQSDHPEKFPCIILGEDQTVDDTRELSPSVAVSTVYQTLHIFSQKSGLVEAKQIGGAIQRAVRRTTFDSNDPDILCMEVWFEGARYMRDPDGKTAHGIVTLRGRVQEPWRVPA